MTKINTKKKQRNVKSGSNPTIDQSKSRDFITVDELELLVKACSKTKYPLRNKAMILTMFWHGLRVSELCNLKIADLNLKTGQLYVNRLKDSLSTTHPVRPDVLRTIKRYLKNRNSSLRTIFVNERGDQYQRQGINYLLKSLSDKAGLPFSVNPHMLRHGCGYELVNMGLDARLIQDYLGHKTIQNTVRYTRTSAKRFEAIWD